MYHFPEEELKKLHINDLKVLANHYGLSYPEDIKKKDLIKKLVHGEPVPEVPKYSVRLQRIMDQMEKKDG